MHRFPPLFPPLFPPFHRLICLLAMSTGMLLGCRSLPIPSEHDGNSDANQISVSVASNPFVTGRTTCSERFVTHTLDHITMVPGGDTVRMFEANGGGVAINDLDGDGWLDIVLANHRDPSTILWNQGAGNDGAVIFEAVTFEGTTFETVRIGNGDARAVTIADVDGDNLLDIVFSRRTSAPNFWRNLGNRHFEQVTLAGVSKPLYAINWGDLDQDGDLDLVGGTYDAGLLAEFGQEFLNGSEAGVYVYSQIDGGIGPAFQGKPLALNAQALALALVDLNGDHRLDILVGNDFGVPDYGWQQVPSTGSAGGAGDANEYEMTWEALPISVMSHSTMSYAAGDVNNDGHFEIFSTDMLPYTTDPETMAAWEPVMTAMMDEEHAEDDPQIMANVLRPAGQASVDNMAVDLAINFGVNASGWSWSGKFGDLDQDGLLDLYIVNGMIEATTFAHLPNHELREENQIFRNLDGTGFAPMPDWSLNSTESGRGMSMADLDRDGDLDIVVNNLRGPAQLFENQLCAGHSLLVDLKWLESKNTRALGSLVTLHTTAGIYQRRVEAASGYLSGDPSQLHFGFADDVGLLKLEVRWPDGGVSVIEEVERNNQVVVVR